MEHANNNNLIIQHIVFLIAVNSSLNYFFFQGKRHFHVETWTRKLDLGNAHEKPPKKGTSSH